jgi:acidic type I keratin
VEVDAPKSQDLGKIMADIRAQYEELAQKNREELDKYWSQQVHKGKGWLPGCGREAIRETRASQTLPTLQIEESTTVVTSQSAEIGAAEMTLTELRRTFQALEIDLDSMRNLVSALWSSVPVPLDNPHPLSVGLEPKSYTSHHGFP